MDVNIYASRPDQAEPLLGNHENTEVGEFLRDYLDLDVDSITKELKDRSSTFDMMQANGEKESWMGKSPDGSRELDGFDHYHGEFKRDLEKGHWH